MSFRVYAEWVEKKIEPEPQKQQESNPFREVHRQSLERRRRLKDETSSKQNKADSEARVIRDSED